MQNFDDQIITMYKHGIVYFKNIPERPEPIPISQNAQTASLPKDFPPGAFLRIGPNGADSTEGWMDGDGMVHCVAFPKTTTTSTTCTYSCTYVETRGRKLEAKSKTGNRFRGTLGSAPRGWPLLQSILTNAWNFQTLEAQKDTCNTALAISGNRILALMEQCPPSEIAINPNTGRVRKVPKDDHHHPPIAIPWSPMTGGNLSAHGRTYGQHRFHVSYSPNAPPYLRVDVFETNWKLIQSIPVHTQLPTMLHDCAVIEQYVIILDFPLTLRTSRFLQDRFPVEYEPEYGARIGLLHKQAQDDKNIQWFDVKPGVVLHIANAYEEQDSNNNQKVVVQVLRSEPNESKAYIEEYASSFLYQYELNLSTGSVQEYCLNPQEVVEFPVIREDQTGKPTEAIYCINVASIGGPLETHRQPKTGINIDGITKFNSQGTVVGRYTVPNSRWFVVSEPTVVAKTNGADGEYVLLIITNVPPGNWGDIRDEQLTSKFLILDGDQLDQGPVWSCTLPHHIPYGLHSLFAPWETMAEA
jgi:carotenoid cleavage dioxygenase